MHIFTTFIKLYFSYTDIKLTNYWQQRVHQDTNNFRCPSSSFLMTFYFHTWLFIITSFQYSAAALQPLSCFFQMHMVFIHHTFERLSVKNFPAISWSVWTGNELALNLAPSLKQAKVIKRNMNCDASEKWQTPSVTQDENMEKLRLLSVLSDTIFCNCFFMLLCEQHRKIGAIEAIGLHDTGQEKECN